MVSPGKPAWKGPACPGLTFNHDKGRIMQEKSGFAAILMLAGLLFGPLASGAEKGGELTANLGLASNYVWRGITLSSDQAAIQGGLDYQLNNGVYLGTWLSNAAGDGYEQDWYGGYGFRTDEVVWDVGYILYTYPVQSGRNFGELYANLTWRMLNGGIALTLNADNDPGNRADSGDVFLYIGGTWNVNGVDLGGTLGNHSRGRNGFDNYSYLELFLRKERFAFRFAKNTLDGNAGDYRFWVDYTMDFELM